tara:strand:+ start:125 stop:253 length:129 start_codon:yes stop_codon:yes gene_type:complete
MFAKKIVLEYYPNIFKDIEKWRKQGFKGHIRIKNDKTKRIPK